VGLENLKVRDHLEEIGTVGIRRDLKGIGLEVVDCIHLAQGRDQWWAHMNTVMNFQVPYKVGNLFTS